MSDSSSAAVTLVPAGLAARIRSILWLATAGVIAVLMIVRVAIEPEWRQLLFLPLLVVIVAVTPFMTRATRVVVEPGVALTRLELLGWRRFPIGSGVEILHFARVHGPKESAYNTSPVGPVDPRWAVIRVDGHVRIRLSMSSWSREHLAELAVLVPARLCIVDEDVTLPQVLAAEPEYYTWWERHLGAYWTVFWLALVLGPVSLILALVAAR